MYSTPRLLSIFCVILCAMGAVGAIMVVMGISTMPTVPFSVVFASAMFLAATVLISLFVTISLRSLCQDLQMNDDVTSQKLQDMKKKLEKLEAQGK